MNTKYPLLETVPAGDSSLILAAGEMLYDKTPTWIWARSLGRFGYSGARLYVVRVAHHTEVRTPLDIIPFAVKIGPKEKMIREREPYPRVCSILGLSHKYVSLEDHPDAALAATFYGDANGLVRELRDLLFPSTSQGETISGNSVEPEVQSLFSRLYQEGLEKMHSSHAEQFTDFREDYGVTAEIHEKIDNRLRGMLGDKPVDSSNLRRVFNSIVQDKIILLRGEIHGDLHPSNVVIIPASNAIHLIDFADSVEKGHLLKDFVLMECSVRFHRFPRSVNFATQKTFDVAISKWGFDPSAASRSVEHCRLKQQYERLASFVFAIRSAAKIRSEKLQHKWSHSVYLKALFLQLYKQMQYESYGHSAGTALIQMTKNFKM